MIEVKRINKVDENILNIITTWMYDFEGREKGYSFEEVKSFFMMGMSDEYPHTYGLFMNDKIIGMCQVSYGVLCIGNEFYPWIVNFFIDKDYRNKGYWRMLFESVIEILKETTDFKMAILNTEIKGLFEKLGCYFLCETDMKLSGKTTMERIYRVPLK